MGKKRKRYGKGKRKKKMRHIRYFSIFIIRFQKNDFPHFTLVETVAQRNNVTCPTSHSQYVRSHHLNPGLHSRAQSLSILPYGLQRGCSQNMFGLWIVPKCVTQCLKERNAVLLSSNRLCSFHEDRLSTAWPTFPFLFSANRLSRSMALFGSVAQLG